MRGNTRSCFVAMLVQTGPVRPDSLTFSAALPEQIHTECIVSVSDLYF